MTPTALIEELKTATERYRHERALYRAERQRLEAVIVRAENLVASYGSAAQSPSDQREPL